MAKILIVEDDPDLVETYTDLLETELEAKGDRVDYVKYPGVDHNGIVDAAGADAMAFFQQRLPTSR